MSVSQNSTENRSSPLFMSDRGIDMNMEESQSQDSEMTIKHEDLNREGLNVSYPSGMACLAII